MYPHRIRLRGPWEAFNADGATQRVDLPAGWSEFIAASLSASWLLRRRFGLPRIIDQDEDVSLICEFDGKSSIRLNGVVIEPMHVSSHYSEWKVTQGLQPRNMVELSVTSNSGSVAPPEVALEIRGPVFLRDVVPNPTGWTGQVVGEQRRHLEVHLLAQGRAVVRVPVQANQSFAVLRPDELPEGSYNQQAPAWTIELIEMANRWYSIDVQAPRVVVPR